jgi:hypothetical protein
MVFGQSQGGLPPVQTRIPKGQMVTALHDNEIEPGRAMLRETTIVQAGTRPCRRRSASSSSSWL